MDKIFDNRTEFTNYQNTQIVPSCVPFLGIFNQSILIVLEQYTNYDRPNMINYPRLEKIVQILKKIDSYKDFRYTKFKKNNEIYSLINIVRFFKTSN